MVDKKFISDESTRESETAISDLPVKARFLKFLMDTEWRKSLFVEAEEANKIYTNFLESLLWGFMKRMVSYKKYKRLTTDQKEKITESLKLLFLEEPNMSKAEEKVIKKYWLSVYRYQIILWGN